jgi:hypothetical protein
MVNLGGLPVKYRGMYVVGLEALRKQNGDDIPAFGAAKVLGAATFTARNRIRFALSFSGFFLLFLALFPRDFGVPPLSRKTVSKHSK